MKKAILTTAAVIGLFLTVNAQTAPAKPEFKKVVVIPVEDYTTLTEALNNSKSNIIYQPSLTSEQAIQIQKQIDAYLSGLDKRVKLDSVKVGDKK